MAQQDGRRHLPGLDAPAVADDLLRVHVGQVADALNLVLIGQGLVDAEGQGLRAGLHAHRLLGDTGHADGASQAFLIVNEHHGRVAGLVRQMALVGHTLTQVVHRLHFCRSMTAILSTVCIEKTFPKRGC